MDRSVIVCVLAMACGRTLFAAAPEVEITGDRVNLRARNDLRSEVVGQARRGDRLALVDAGEAWFEVRPPESVGFWVHRDFVSDGEVKTGPLNVRCGPGINYTRAASIEKGARVAVQQASGDWLQIAAPPGATLFVSRDFAREVRPPAVAAAPEPPPAQPPPVPRPVVVSPPPVRPVEPGPAAGTAEPGRYVPGDLRLAASVPQGAVVDVTGIVRRVTFLLNRPSKYQLVASGTARPETLYYLRGNDPQLAGFEGETLRLRGREYWVQGVRKPVLVVDQIAVRR